MEKEELKAILQQISDAELKLGVLMNTINQSNLDIENLSKIKSDLELKIENTYKEVDLLNKQLAIAGIQNQEQIASLNTQKLSAQHDFDISKKGYENSINSLKELIANLQKSYDSKMAELSANFNQSKTSYESTILTLKNQISSYEGILNNLSEQNNTLSMEVSNILIKKDIASAELSSINSELTNANANLISINNEIKNNTIILDEIKHNIVVNQNVFDSLKFNLSDITSEVTDLTNHRESIKTVLAKDLILHDDYIKERLNLVTLQDSLTQKENLLKYKFEKAGISYN